jgi:hypothetical protein
MAPALLTRTIAALQARRATHAMIEGATLGLAVAGGVAVVLMAWQTAVTVILLVSALLTVAGAAWRRHQRAESMIAAAMRIEAADPSAQNVVRTAVELSGAPACTSVTVRTRVLADAERVVQRIDVTRMVPLQRVLAQAAVVAVLWTLTLVSSPTMAPAFSAVSRAASVPLSSVAIRIAPPAYLDADERTERDPSRITVRAGSALRLTVRGGAARVVVARTARTDTLVPAADGAVILEWRAETDDALVLVALDSADALLEQRLIGISVVPDLAPRVSVTAPGADLLIPNGDRRLALTVRAEDDVALASLRVRFTTVRGNGEQFSFSEGDVPLAITRRSRTDWQATGELRLDTLSLEPGDVVVYRAVATDQRPGTAPTESDTWIVEVTAPGAVAAEGFAADEDQDRYALSQHMVIIKTERLLAQRSSLSPDEFTRAALTLAAEQRSVRAEFVFMMGGELGEEDNTGAGHLHVDESAEAEAEDDIYAGRLANQGRLELTRAVRSMSLAATRLNDMALADALVEEKRALTYIERALARSRFILRALTQRERIDLSRRLSGTLTAVRPDLRAGREPELSTRVQVLRRAIADIAAVAAAPTVDAATRRAMQSTASALLQMAPGDTTLQSATAELVRAVGPTVRADTRAARLSVIVRQLISVVRAELPQGAAAVPSFEERMLRAAVRDGARQ